MGIFGGVEGVCYGLVMMVSGLEGGWECVELWFEKVVVSYKGELCFVCVG